MSTRDLALRALIVKHLADRTAAAIREHRASLAEEMANGDRVTVASPDGPAEMGQVWRTKPKGTATVTDRAAFTAWMAERYPERVDTVWQIPEGGWDAVVTLLQEHAPHLLTTHSLVSCWAENEVLKVTERARRACGPGGELDIPGVAYEPPGRGVVTVRLSEDGPALIEDLWRCGRIELDGTVTALPTGGTP